MLAGFRELNSYEAIGCRTAELVCIFQNRRPYHLRKPKVQLFNEHCVDRPFELKV